MLSLEEAPLESQRVLLRIDANVPLDEGASGKISDDSRLRAIVPTIHYLLGKKAKVIILSRLGRPEGKVVPELSLKPIYEHLSRLIDQKITFWPEHPKELAQRTLDLKNGEVVGLENLRFYPEEKASDEKFAIQLAALGDIYVNESFSESHRHSTSLVEITSHLPSYAGIQLEKEYRVLSNLLRHPARPFMAVIGGAKIADKLPACKGLIDNVDRLLVGGGVANTFLVAQGEYVGTSLVDKELIPEAGKLLKLGRGKIVLPSDSVKQGEAIYDIGSQTVKTFIGYLAKAKTVFWSGNLGVSEKSEFRNGSERIAQALAESPATTIIGGGNTVELINSLKLGQKMTFVSTGGSAALKLLAGGKLPAIEALERSHPPA